MYFNLFFQFCSLFVPLFDFKPNFVWKVAVSIIVFLLFWVWSRSQICWSKNKEIFFSVFFFILNINKLSLWPTSQTTDRSTHWIFFIGVQHAFLALISWCLVLYRPLRMRYTMCVCERGTERKKSEWFKFNRYSFLVPRSSLLWSTIDSHSDWLFYAVSHTLFLFVFFASSSAMVSIEFCDLHCDGHALCCAHSSFDTIDRRHLKIYLYSIPCSISWLTCSDSFVAMLSLFTWMI